MLVPCDKNDREIRIGDSVCYKEGTFTVQTFGLEEEHADSFHAPSRVFFLVCIGNKHEMRVVLANDLATLERRRRVVTPCGVCGGRFAPGEGLMNLVNVLHPATLDPVFVACHFCCGLFNLQRASLLAASFSTDAPSQPRGRQGWPGSPHYAATSPST